MQRLPVFAAALWWGSLTTLGFGVVPLLFACLPTPAMAGTLAARLFTAQTWVSVACALLLLATLRGKSTSKLDFQLVNAGKSALFFVAIGVLLAVLSEFLIAPRIVARDNLRLWHSAGSMMYLLQWLMSGMVLWKLAQRHTGPAALSTGPG